MKYRFAGVAYPTRMIQFLHISLQCAILTFLTRVLELPAVCCQRLFQRPLSMATASSGAIPASFLCYDSLRSQRRRPSLCLATGNFPKEEAAPTPSYCTLHCSSIHPTIYLSSQLRRTKMTSHRRPPPVLHPSRPRGWKKRSPRRGSNSRP
ncbi:hypothetical protein EJ06DRAFT_353744 [Trichodelitschia bisporula]|uniref:Uncharacterized protein n=1 Tax=Trichodelitschia bisporula TaxID=703511 RepID=A0A6G1I0P7_9PEZI|nr:hypothetical protein EJ06DRAFT_353744 [Trichodelitschia bisporula]